MMRKFTQMIIMLVLLFCFNAKAVSELEWDRDCLRANVQCYVGRILSNMVVYARSGNNRAYANVCNARIEFLKQFLKNAIFLPVDVSSYIERMNVGIDSYEAQELMKISLMSQTEESWKRSIRGLIKVYEELSSEYESCLRFLF